MSDYADLNHWWFDDEFEDELDQAAVAYDSDDPLAELVMEVVGPGY